MVARGKSKRRREVNLKIAHEESSNFSTLAPPPKAKDIMAVPSKLRRIMQFKAAAQKKDTKREIPEAKGLQKKQNLGVSVVQESNKNSSVGSVKASPSKAENKTQGTSMNPDGVLEEEKSTKEKKRKKDVSIGNWKLSLAMKGKSFSPKKGNLKEKKKQFLQKKKKKGKESRVVFDELNIKPVIQFGDIVQGPPKLSAKPRPSKRPYVEAIKTQENESKTPHHWPESLGDKAASQERLRLAAVEKYRNKRNWTSRPGSATLPEKLIDLG